MAVVQAGGKTIVGLGDAILDEADRAGREMGCLARRGEIEHPVGFRRRDEGIEGRVGVAGDAEDGMETAFPVGGEHVEGKAAPVIDDDIALAHMLKMGERSPALVVMGEQVKIDRNAGGQPV